jgi:peroxiredoxin
MAIRLGRRAPDFTLKDQEDRPVRLSDFRGRNVVLAFFPLAWTPI